MNALLQQISEAASTDLQDLIESGEKDILAAIHKMEAEAQLQETAPKFNLGFKITVDLDKSTFDCDLSWTLKQSLGVSHQIDDPKQDKLPLAGVKGFAQTVAKSGVTMTLKTGGKEVTITPEQAEKAVERINNAAKS